MFLKCGENWRDEGENKENDHQIISPPMKSGKWIKGDEEWITNLQSDTSNSTEVEVSSTSTPYIFTPCLFHNPF